jgi:hypothetical protein
MVHKENEHILGKSKQVFASVSSCVAHVLVFLFPCRSLSHPQMEDPAEGLGRPMPAQQRRQQQRGGGSGCARAWRRSTRHAERGQQGQQRVCVAVGGSLAGAGSTPIRSGGREPGGSRRRAGRVPAATGGSCPCCECRAAGSGGTDSLARSAAAIRAAAAGGGGGGWGSAAAWAGAVCAGWPARHAAPASGEVPGWQPVCYARFVGPRRLSGRGHCLGNQRAVFCCWEAYVYSWVNLSKAVLGPWEAALSPAAAGSIDDAKSWAAALLDAAGTPWCAALQPSMLLLLPGLTWL